MSYARVRVEKIGTYFQLEIDGKVAKFGTDSSNILTGDIKSGSEFNGIFSSNYEVPFYKGSVKLHINFTMPWSIGNYVDNPLAEIRRRVRLVQETFAKAEAEKEVWEGIVVGSLLTEPEKPETFTIIYTGSQGEGYKYVTTISRSLLQNKLSEFSNPIFVFKGIPETV